MHIHNHSNKQENSSHAFSLPENFKMGVATAATQIEGGDSNNSWYDWAQTNHIKDGSSPLRADDHFNRVEEDTALLASMKIQIYRMGLEWSRIEPAEGVFDDEVIQHYIDEILLLKKKGIECLVTLHHFSNPRWFEEKGSFANADSTELFMQFVRYSVEKLCPYVSEWITVNEPNVYAVNGWLYGIWPPGKKSFNSVRNVYKNLAAAHIKSYIEIHRISKEKGIENVKVGFANHLHSFSARQSWNIFHKLCALIVNKGFQYSLTDACMTGKFGFFVPRVKGVEHGRYYDFVGINYYTRDSVGFLSVKPFKGKAVNDLGWEIRPEGIAEFARYMYHRYQAPVYITENGTADKHDNFRAEYIYTHLKSLCNSGVPVERYYHWTFMDNFEWLEGESACFGLVAVDYATEKRTIRRSGVFFTKIIENHGVTDEMYNEYIGGEMQ